MKKGNRKYDAGYSTANVDRKRGMNLEDMHKVAHVRGPSDHPDWAQGYRDRLEEMKEKTVKVYKSAKGCKHNWEYSHGTIYKCIECGCLGKTTQTGKRAGKIHKINNC